MQEHSLRHPDFLLWAGNLHHTTKKAALQGAVSVWAAAGLREGRLGSGVTGKDWRAVLGRVRCSQHKKYPTTPLLNVS